ncbi:MULTISPECIES: catalase family protein [Bradyrhizobium]|uniref:Catalase n=1 Tax=Bradyrhizobium canariense TaxID=255045 RepID=A0A1X3GYU8_9BRAD|nr:MULTISPECIES: catalase family protein [Bradyrhizobium]OSI64649.1 catalase [Bradyrhizobium canariense]OSI79177.1 catalase [Bradyrhizobium canariense]OSI90719.1 catalase [Bradyrhizobium canariense]OSI91621.1 catalase [Bradyrhizobium canariense]OSJ03687.1 catalase [Bradyrhizobium canariense]
MNAPLIFPRKAADAPIRFSPSVERLDPDEAATIEGLIATMRYVNERTFADGRHAIRSVHAKTQGILEGYLEVDAGLPIELAQGLFAKPGRYPVVMRFSTVPGDILDDSVSTPRGLAVKIIGVEGERLSGSEGDVTQDFVLVNGPAFGAPTPKKFLPVITLLSKTTNRVQRLKKLLSAVMRQVQRAIVSVTGQPNTTVATLGGQPETHILGETFYNQAPVRFGDFIAKISVSPISSELAALKGAALNVNGIPNGIREAVVAFFKQSGGVWEVRAQLCTDLNLMPIENAATVWPEQLSPYRRIGRIEVTRQNSWSEARSSVVDDGMQFSPWHGLAAHRPLGGIMRARKEVYAAAKRFRAARNGRVIEEPRQKPDLGD